MSNTLAPTPFAQQNSSKSSGYIWTCSTYPTGRESMPSSSTPRSDPVRMYRKSPRWTRYLINVTTLGHRCTSSITTTVLFATIGCVAAIDMRISRSSALFAAKNESRTDASAIRSNVTTFSNDSFAKTLTKYDFPTCRAPLTKRALLGDEASQDSNCAFAFLCSISVPLITCCFSTRIHFSVVARCSFRHFFEILKCVLRHFSVLLHGIFRHFFGFKPNSSRRNQAPSAHHFAGGA